MKSKNFVSVLFFIAALLVWNCGGKNSPKKEPVNVKEVKDTTIAVKVKNNAIPKVESITEKEALKRMRQFININKRKYLNSDYAQIDDIESVFGDFNADMVTDYFFNVTIDYGGDFIPTHHFLYDSKEDKIREIIVDEQPDSWSHITPRAIQENKIIGTAHLWKAVSPDFIATQEVKSGFTILGNKLSIAPDSKKAVLAAHKKVLKEYAQMEKDFMESQQSYEETEEEQ